MLFAANIYMAISVGRARKRFNVPYPTLYAVPGTPRQYGPKTEETAVTATSSTPLPTGGQSEVFTNEEAFGFNIVQRGHQNTLENGLFVCFYRAQSGGGVLPQK